LIQLKTSVTSPKYSILINGGLCDYFLGKRGLRQGDPLPPYLFVIAMGILSCTLNSAAATGGLRYDPKCRRVSLAHLCSADDLMVFTNGPLEDLQAINSILKDAHHLSGLKCDPAKSELYHAGVSDDLAERLKEESGFKVGLLPVKYLGMLLISGKLDYNDCRIHHWASKSLSFAGTLQLISSVIFSIANYWCNYLYSEVIFNDQRIWPYARSWLIYIQASICGIISPSSSSEDNVVWKIDTGWNIF